LRSALTIAWLVILAAGIGCSRTTDPAAARWLRQGCAMGEPRVPETDLRMGGDSAAGELLRAYHDGPGRLADEIANEAGREYDEVIDALDHNRTYGLTASEIDAIRRETRAVHVRDARDDFEDAYRGAALAGLAVIGRPQDVALLRSIASTAGSADRDKAVSALRQAGIPVTPP